MSFRERETPSNEEDEQREQLEEEYEGLRDHLARTAHVHHESTSLKSDLWQHTYRSFAFGCFVLFVTLIQTIHVWEGEVLPASRLTGSVSPHPERTLLKVVDAHEQTIALRWVFGFELLLLLLCWLLRLASGLRGRLTTMRLQFLLLWSGCCGIFHVGAFGVRLYTLWLVHFSWPACLAAFLDFLWLAINWSTFFTLVNLLRTKEHAQHLHNTNPSKFFSSSQ